jgi:hypothetical protein
VRISKPSFSRLDKNLISSKSSMVGIIRFYMQ